MKLRKNQHPKFLKNQIWFMTILILTNSILRMKSLMRFLNTQFIKALISFFNKIMEVNNTKPRKDEEKRGKSYCEQYSF